MIILRIYNTNNTPLFDLLCENASYTSQINQAGKFNVSISFNELSKTDFNLANTYFAELIYRGKSIAKGIIDNASPNYINQIINISCNSDLEELTRLRAKSDAVYQNQQVLAIIKDLLSRASGWQLGDVSTMVDPLITTTIDLRGEKRLFSQILQTVQSVPNCFLRFGGYDNGTKFLDIGLFDRHIQKEVNIIELSRSIKYSEVLKSIEAYGGEYESSGVTEIISLEDALNYDSTLSTNAEFPIITDGVSFIVENSTNDAITSTIELYTNIVPQTKVDPSVDEINQAGYALWLKASAELALKANKAEDWSASTLELPDDILVGDRIYVNFKVSSLIHSGFSQLTEYRNIESISEWFRINSIALDINSNTVKYNLTISTSVKLPEKDPILTLFDSTTADRQSQDALPNLSTTLVNYLYSNIFVGSGQNPDDNLYVDELGANVDVLTITIPQPIVPPPLATIMNIGAKIISTLQDVIIKFVSIPTDLISPLIIQIAYPGGWNTNLSTNLFILWEYS